MEKLLLAVLLAFSGAANATTLTFDDLNGGYQQIPANYNSFDFSTFGLLNNSDGFGVHASSGFVYAYAYCCNNSDTIQCSAGGLFNFISADFSDVQKITDTFTVKGFLSSNELYSFALTVNGNITTQSLDFYGMDKVTFSSNNRSNLALDNLELTTGNVPEPGSIASHCLALACSALLHHAASQQCNTSDSWIIPIECVRVTGGSPRKAHQNIPWSTQFDRIPAEPRIYDIG